MKAFVGNEQQLQIMKSSPGFIAALDQSGGSTPHALRDYGIKEDAWSSEEEMFAIVHQMRARIMTSPSFNGERILGAILFENTMDREIKGRPTAAYLWSLTNVVAFHTVDQGLAPEKDGVRLMKPILSSWGCWIRPRKSAFSARRCAPSSSSRTRGASTRSSISNSSSPGRLSRPASC